MKRWLIKDKKGRIFGPHTEDEICFYIDEGEFRGEELFSAYPVGKWKPISSHSVFYERILNQLHADGRHTKAKTAKSKVTLKSNFTRKTFESDTIEPTQIIVPKTRKTSSGKKPRTKVKIKLSDEFKEEVLEAEGEESIIEMDELKKGFVFNVKKIFKVLFLLAVSFVVAIVFLLPEKRHNMEGRARLLSVRKKALPLETKVIREKLKIALHGYFKSRISFYLNSQRQYVQILESDPSQVDIYSHLCMIYLEIWPFSYQDTKDTHTLHKTLNMVNSKDKTNTSSGLCNSVQALINKKPQRALMVVNTVLNNLDENYPPIFLYYVKARALKDLDRVEESRSYLQSIHQLKPKWIAPYMMNAQMYYEAKQYDLATKLYQKVLAIDPKHPSAGLRMGLLEYKYLKKYQKGKERLKSVLIGLNEFIKPFILMEAYVTLAGMYLKQNNKKKMLEYSNKAYSLDPEHPDVVMLRRKLKDVSHFQDTKMQAWGLIYKGDILVSQGKCAKARNYFYKAYMADSKRNALAALRMAQCYWESRHSGQAIRWLRKSINADPKMMEAYFLLSDYLSAIYDFESAKEILHVVKDHQPSNYDLFKAYALLYFRKKHYDSAISYAKRALEFYSFDTELHVLLSKSHLALNQGNKAFVYAQKALQENASHTEAQIAYALSLDLVYSYRKAHKYFKTLIKQYPLIPAYPHALAKFYFSKNKTQEALEELEIVIANNKEYKPAHMLLGEIYTHLSIKEGKRGTKYDQALQAFLSASLLDISDPEPLFQSGIAYLEHKQYDLAETQFEKVLQINTHYPLIHYYIGLVNFYQQGEENLEKALKYAKTGAARDPNNFLSYKLSGDVYRLLSKGVFESIEKKQAVYELCAKAYQKALKYAQMDIDISIGLLECYKGAGNLNAALDLAFQMTRIEGLSGYPEIYKEIGGIFELKNQYEKARSFYSSYFSLKPGAKDRKKIETRIAKLIQEKKTLSAEKKE